MIQSDPVVNDLNCNVASVVPPSTTLAGYNEPIRIAKEEGIVTTLPMQSSFHEVTAAAAARVDDTLLLS